MLETIAVTEPVRLALRIVAEAGVALRIGGIEPGARCSLWLPRRELPAHDIGAAVFTCQRRGSP